MEVCLQIKSIAPQLRIFMWNIFSYRPTCIAGSESQYLNCQHIYMFRIPRGFVKCKFRVYWRYLHGRVHKNWAIAHIGTITCHLEMLILQPLEVWFLHLWWRYLHKISTKWKLRTYRVRLTYIWCVKCYMLYYKLK